MPASSRLSEIDEGNHDETKLASSQGGPGHEQLCWVASKRGTGLAATLHTVSGAGGALFSRCVSANLACGCFRRRHLPKWRRCPPRQRYDCQLRHWIETERSY
jgi:hypothetical protein